MKKYTKKTVELEAAYFDGTKESVESLQASLGKALVNIQPCGVKEKFELNIKNTSGEKLLVKPTQWIVKEDNTKGGINFLVVNDEDFNAIFNIPESAPAVETPSVETDEDSKELKKKNK